MRTDRWSENDILANLMDQHWAPLECFACRRLRDPETAKELVQEVFVRLWCRLDTTNPALVRGWLFRVLRNLITDHWRSAKPSELDPQLLFRLFASGTATEAPDPAVILVNQEAQRVLRDALQQLPAAYRQIVELQLGGFTYQEIAVRLGIPLGTVKSRRNYALLRLRQILANKQELVV